MHSYIGSLDPNDGSMATSFRAAPMRCEARAAGAPCRWSRKQTNAAGHQVVHERSSGEIVERSPECALGELLGDAEFSGYFGRGVVQHLLGSEAAGDTWEEQLGRPLFRGFELRLHMPIEHLHRFFGQVDDVATLLLRRLHHFFALGV
jgi:hypothetical protein